MGKLLGRGMLAGLLAAFVAFLIARFVGEGSVEQAIALEAAAAEAAGEAEESAQVSRGVQSGLGLAVGVAVYGSAIGGLFAIAYAFAAGRLGRLGARATAALLAGTGFVAVFLVPFLKYPANPPAVGSGETIGRRTGLFLLMLVISVAAATGATVLARQAAPRLGSWNAAAAGIAGYLAVVLLATVLLPAINEVGRDFPATVLWEFRTASIQIQAALWTVLGLTFGALTERAAHRTAAVRPATAAPGPPDARPEPTVG